METPLDTAEIMVDRPNKFLLSVVVPCFNEHDVIGLTYGRIVDVLGTRDFRLQIIFVDDGSDDRTPYLAAELAHRDPRVKTVLLSRNFGHQAAVSAGLANADGDAITVMDADLQDPPEVVSTAFAPNARSRFSSVPLIIPFTESFTNLLTLILRWAPVTFRYSIVKYWMSSISCRRKTGFFVVFAPGAGSVKPALPMSGTPARPALPSTRCAS